MRVLMAAVALTACVASGPEPQPGQGSPSPEPEAKTVAKSRVAPELLALYEGGVADDPESPMTAPLSVRDGRVLVDCAAEGDAEALAAALEELGMIQTEVFQRVISGWLPIDAIGQLEALEGLRLARPSAAQTHSSPQDDNHTKELP